VFTAQYEEAYFKFVSGQIIPKYQSPSLPIFLAAGPMTTVYLKPVKRVIARLQKAKIKAYYLDLDVGNYHPTGCNGHPSVDTHYRVMQAAREQITRVLNW